jgi:hypothetical protein
MLTKTIVPDSTHTDTDVVFGFSIQEDSSATAAVELRSGSATGQIVVFLNLAVDETATIVLPKAVFWEFPGGCHVKEVSGSVAGVLYHR